MTRCAICHDPLPDDGPTCGGFTCAMRDAGWRQLFEGALFSDGNTYWHRKGKAVSDGAARKHWRDTGNTPPPF